MNRQKALVLLLTVISLSGTIILYQHTNPVFGLTENQTVPTRTPTPLPPTATSPPGNTPPGSTPPSTGDTPTPGPTATSTFIPVTIAATPIGGFLPTSTPCSNQPKIQAINTTNVRSGPGVDYDKVDELAFLEVRYIVGRAGDAEWWLILLDGGQFGWVADAVVTVQGYIAIVPIVAPPPINGQQPTPGSPWNPTPLPTCTVTPVPTNTPTLEPTAEATLETAATEAEPTETPTPAETLEATTENPVPTPIPPTATLVSSPTRIAAQPTALPTVALASNTDEPTSSGYTGFILIGAALVILAGIIIIMMRRRGQSSET